MTDRQGVEIDYCPKCRGVWLDRGELQKLIDASLAQLPSRPPVLPSSEVVERHYDQRRDRGYYADQDSDRQREHYDRSTHYDKHKPKKRESWLSELFDFD